MRQLLVCQDARLNELSPMEKNVLCVTIPRERVRLSPALHVAELWLTSSLQEMNRKYDGPTWFYESWEMVLGTFGLDMRYVLSLNSDPIVGVPTGPTSLCTCVLAESRLRVAMCH